MSIYHDSFTYKGINSLDKDLIIVAFDADNGETDTFLSMDNQLSDLKNGVSNDYGAKYNTQANIRVTLIRKDCKNFTQSQFYDVAKWLTGAKYSSWLDLYIGSDINYSFLCKCVDLKQYKMDARTIGVIAEFQSISPWAYSPIQYIGTQNQTISGTQSFSIDVPSHDLYIPIFTDVEFSNTTGTSLSLSNKTLGMETKVNNLATSEKVTLKGSAQILYSSKDTRIFGDDFNYIWFQLCAGTNEVEITGNGTITISYRYPIKAGDCVIDV